MDNDGPRARYVLGKMQILYAVERRIKEEHLQPAQILELRQSASVPVLKELKEWMLIEEQCIAQKPYRNGDGI